MDPVSNRFTCNPSDLGNIRGFVDSFVQQHEPSAWMVVNAVDELCANIAEHGKAKTVSVTLSKIDGQVVVVIKDRGKKFDLTKYESKDPMELIKLRATGGLGLTFIKRVMDLVTYERVGKVNICTCYKKAA